MILNTLSSSKICWKSSSNVFWWNLRVSIKRYKVILLLKTSRFRLSTKLWFKFGIRYFDFTLNKFLWGQILIYPNNVGHKFYIEILDSRRQRLMKLNPEFFGIYSYPEYSKLIGKNWKQGLLLWSYKEITQLLTYRRDPKWPYDQNQVSVFYLGFPLHLKSL